MKVTTNSDAKTEEGICTAWRGTYGFVKPESGSDLLVHYSSLVMDGHKQLARGQRVTFWRQVTEQGDRAMDVRVVGGGGHE